MTNPSGNLERFSGFADVYDRYRPVPPPVLVDILLQLARTERPAGIVDLGCGTGLSTSLWAGRATHVLGVDPNEDMLRVAENRLADVPDGTTMEFRRAVSADTGLADASVDVVTVSQALHWMEPGSTLQEAARVLRPGGVFAAYDCDWPPTVDPDVDLAYMELMNRVEVLERELDARSQVRRWAKAEHLDRLRSSGRFRWVKELAVHHIELGDAERFAGLAMSQGGIQGLLRAGYTEVELGLDTLRTVAQTVMGDRSVPFYWTYRVRVGVV